MVTARLSMQYQMPRPDQCSRPCPAALQLFLCMSQHTHLARLQLRYPSLDLQQQSCQLSHQLLRLAM